MRQMVDAEVLAAKDLRELEKVAAWPADEARARQQIPALTRVEVRELHLLFKVQAQYAPREVLQLYNDVRDALDRLDAHLARTQLEWLQRGEFKDR